MLDLIQPTDELLLFAYPHFNVNEILALAEIYEGAARQRGLPMIVFNGGQPQTLLFTVSAPSVMYV